MNNYLKFQNKHINYFKQINLAGNALGGFSAAKPLTKAGQAEPSFRREQAPALQIKICRIYDVQLLLPCTKNPAKS